MKYNTETSWEDASKHNTFPQLEEHLTTDVVVIGGGLSGIVTAYLLSKENRNVVVLEKGRLGEGATGMTTAFLTEIIDTDGRDLPPMIGIEKTREIYESHRTAINTVARIMSDENIECEFSRVSNKIFAHKPEAWEDLKKEFVALTDAGVTARIQETNGLGFKHFGYIDIPNQAKFHPLKFLEGVAGAARTQGVKIFEHTEALDAIKEHADWLVTTPHGSVRANHVVSATHNPFKEPAGLYLRKGLYTTYIIEGTLPAGMVKEGIYEDTMIPYHYFRIDKGEGRDRILIGGEDHRSDFPVDPAKCFSALREFAAELFGEHFHQQHLWTGPILEPSDGLPLIGEHNTGGILYASAFSGNGMTYSIISGLLLTDLIMGRHNPWKDLYNPDRFPSPRALLTKGRDYSQEFLHGALKNTFRHRARRL